MKDELQNNILPDEEDLTLVENLIKFKNRIKDPNKHTGRGYKILRLCNPESPTGNILQLSDMMDTNTIYEIRYDFDLNNIDLKIQENCILYFNGGNLSNGVVITNEHTKIYGNNALLDNVRIQVNGTNNEIKDLNINREDGCIRAQPSGEITISNLTIDNIELTCLPAKPDPYAGCAIKLILENGTVSTNVKISRCIIHSNNMGIETQVHNEDSKLENITITNCSFDTYAGDIEGANNMGISLVSEVYNGIIQNCIFKDKKKSIEVISYNAIISNNIILNNDSRSVIEGSSWKNTKSYITNNYIINSPDSNLYFKDCSGIIISNNYIDGIGSIVLQSTNDSVISNNIIKNTTRGSIGFDNCQNNVISDNTFITTDDSDIIAISMYCYDESMYTENHLLKDNVFVNFKENNILADYQRARNIVNVGYKILNNDIKNINNFYDYNNLNLNPTNNIGEDYILLRNGYNRFYSKLYYPGERNRNAYVKIKLKKLMYDYPFLGKIDVIYNQKLNSVIFGTQSWEGNEFVFDILDKNGVKYNVDNSSDPDYHIITIEFVGVIYTINITGYISCPPNNTNNMVYIKTGVSENSDTYPLYNTKTIGAFSEKPLNSDGIQQGFAYFCTDKQTSEGSRNGIMIYYTGDNTWVDALGRVVS